MRLSLGLLMSLLLSACALPPQQIIANAASKCPQIGIDIDSPDFYQKHKPADIEEFYSCMQNELQPSDSYSGEYSPLMPSDVVFGVQYEDRVKARTQAKLAYQKNLWRQVINKEKKPGAAQESWMQWISDISYKQASMDAADRAAENAADESSRQKSAILQQNMRIQQLRSEQQHLNFQQQQIRFQQMQQQMR